VHAELQYVWRNTGDVGDSSPVAIELGIPRRADLVVVPA
jgi:hypothetical protein